MSFLNYQPIKEEDICNNCNKQCGIIITTEDQAYFALACLFCPEKFLYFDAFIGHIQTVHSDLAQSCGMNTMFNISNGNYIMDTNCINNCQDIPDDFADADPTLFEPQMVMIKQEHVDEDARNDVSSIINLPPKDATKTEQHINDTLPQSEQNQLNITQKMKSDPLKSEYLESNSFSSLDFADATDVTMDSDGDDDGTNYDDLVEESLLGVTGLAMHIKDRNMIQFLIESYRRNPFLWDHLHPQFRDRVKRQQFLDWIILEFKRRFNISLAKDAVTRKWDNLRTVYKRECNRMAQEKTNISTLWYFKELHFLSRLYGSNMKMSEAIVKETIYRRRYTALWNDFSTAKLLSLVKEYPCFYDKNNIGYRSKEKRGEALHHMAIELQKTIDVTTIQISKRISQLRFDYSKQKQERLICQANNKVFTPSYNFYEQMSFLDADVAPFKCDYCTQILQTPRELDIHLATHQQSLVDEDLQCTICQISFPDKEQLITHQQVHSANVNAATVAAAAIAQNDVKYCCDLCTASFRGKSNYDEHMRRHNDELLLPSLLVDSTYNNASEMKPFACDTCGKSFTNMNYLNAHRAQHTTERTFKCDYQQCGKTFTARQSLMEHVRLHYNDDEYKCDVCGKGFKSVKNLANHKQIHDAIKRYVCKICGSAFAQAAGLYLHKRRHNRTNVRTNRHSY